MYGEFLAFFALGSIICGIACFGCIISFLSALIYGYDEGYDEDRKSKLWLYGLLVVVLFLLSWSLSPFLQKSADYDHAQYQLQHPQITSTTSYVNV